MSTFSGNSLFASCRFRLLKTRERILLSGFACAIMIGVAGMTALGVLQLALSGKIIFFSRFRQTKNHVKQATSFYTLK